MVREVRRETSRGGRKEVRAHAAHEAQNCERARRRWPNLKRQKSGMMKRMLRPARSEHAGPTPRLWKKNEPNRLRAGEIEKVSEAARDAVLYPPTAHRRRAR